MSEAEVDEIRAVIQRALSHGRT